VPNTPGTGPLPTIVLVHGAWYSPEHWGPLRAALGDVPTVTVDLASTGTDPAELTDMTDDAALIRETVDAVDGPVVVVAHSYGGIPVTEALTHAPNVTRIVYVTSFQLDVGQSLMSSIGGWAPDWWEFDHEAGVMSIARPVEAFLHDVPAAEAAEAAGRMRLQSIRSFEQRLGNAAWRTIPSTYVVTTADAAIPPELQREMARRCERVHELPTSHSPFLAATGELAALLRAELEDGTGAPVRPAAVTR
jgi:pimeloyl-ACP methyl ester carboxylesterase